MKAHLFILSLSLLSSGFAANAQDLFCSKIYLPPSRFERSMRVLVDMNLYDLQGREAQERTAEQIQHSNERVIDNLLNLEPRLYDPVLVSKKGARKFLKEVERKSVVKKQFIYERDDADIGYCFGRATCAHLLSLKRHFNKDQIKKIFVVGPMVNGSTEWAYHVSFLVRGADGQWWAIDNFTPTVLSVRDWYHYMLNMSVDGKLAVYITEPQKLGAIGKYDRFEMGLSLSREEDYYKGYFHDLMQSMRDDSRENAL